VFLQLDSGPHCQAEGWYCKDRKAALRQLQDGIGKVEGPYCESRGPNCTGRKAALRR
jgi:hypothetical protein